MMPPAAMASAEKLPRNGQMLGGRIWYWWFFAPAMIVLVAYVIPAKAGISARTDTGVLSS
jgi:hypothetical protein